MADEQPLPTLKVVAPPELIVTGQQRVNLIWERTQAAISIMVVLANMAVAIYHGLVTPHSEFPVVLSSSLFLVVGFYFSRTNHAAIGGVGPKPFEPYFGR